MNISIWLLIAIVWMHTFADFFLQTDKMAISKSSSHAWLSVHVGVYILPFLLFFGWKYALVNFVLHWITDFCSSRMTTYFWKKEQRHWFFATIGVDQAIHFTCLFATIPLIGW